jgi:hypothetical protein
MNQLFATLTRVISNQTLNEAKVGYASQLGQGISLVEWPVRACTPSLRDQELRSLRGEA